MTEETTDDGVRVVGATTPDDEEATRAEPADPGAEAAPEGRHAASRAGGPSGWSASWP